MHCRRGQCTNGKLEQHRGVLFHPSIKERHSLRWEEVVYRYNIYGSFGVAGEIESTHDQLPCVLGLAITYIGQLRSVRCHGKQIFLIPHQFDHKTCPWSFRTEGRNYYSAEPLIWPLINMHEVSLRTKNKQQRTNFLLSIFPSLQ